MKIFINPGHSDIDSGAVGYNLKESEVAYCIGARVESYLKKFNLQTKLFQNNSLEEICAKSNLWSADLFVSIHCNASKYHTGTGTETFYYFGSVEGKKLATAIQIQLIKTFSELPDRGVKVENHFVTRNTNCTACLVETAFIDFQRDNDLLRTRADDFAKAIAQGILLLIGIVPDVVDKPADNLIICPHCGKSFAL